MAYQLNIEELEKIIALWVHDELSGDDAMNEVVAWSRGINTDCAVLTNTTKE